MDHLKEIRQLLYKVAHPTWTIRLCEACQRHIKEHQETCGPTAHERAAVSPTVVYVKSNPTVELFEAQQAIEHLSKALRHAESRVRFVEREAQAVIAEANKQRQHAEQLSAQKDIQIDSLTNLVRSQEHELKHCIRTEQVFRVYSKPRNPHTVGAWISHAIERIERHPEGLVIWIYRD